MRYSHVCLYCGEAFTTRKPDSRYCSRRCVWDAKFKPECSPRPCHNCGKTFKPKYAKASYCSKACGDTVHVGRKPPNAVGLTAICIECGAVFSTTPSAQQKGGRYCSRECFHKAHARNQMGKGRKRVAVKCHSCGKEYDVIPAWVGRINFCSRECSHAHKRTIRGDAHPLKKPAVKLICTFCRQEYETKPSIAPRSKFCSRHCQGAWTEQNFPHTSKLEQAVDTLLADMDLSFEHCKPMGRFVCDFVLEWASLVIECDGVYWHSLPGRKSIDKRKDTWLTNRGYTVLRLPEHRIKDDINWCRTAIIAACPSVASR